MNAQANRVVTRSQNHAGPPLGLLAILYTALFNARLVPGYGNGRQSWFHLISPGALFLIPLTRFPAFLWLIAVGFALPRIRSSPSDAAAA